jgi:hypothetical protein
LTQQLVPGFQVYATMAVSLFYFPLKIEILVLPFLSLFFSLLAWKFLGDELKDLIHAAFDNQKENKKGPWLSRPSWAFDNKMVHLFIDFSIFVTLTSTKKSREGASGLG